jgi:hypothetical protein
VRITRGRIRVAVVPPVDLTTAVADLRRVPFMLALAMDQTRRFQSVDSGQVNETLLNSKTKGEELLVRPDRAVSLGKSLDVTAWLVPVLIERRGTVYLDVTFISAVTGVALFPAEAPALRGRRRTGSHSRLRTTRAAATLEAPERHRAPSLGRPGAGRGLLRRLRGVAEPA